MKNLLFVGCMLTAQAFAQAPSPVIVELFTSEGCSSCPPADRLLSELDKRQPVSGAQVIVLSEHVDYWNRLGWTDPFSSAQFSQRQQRYGSLLRTEDVYTPQAVIDGQWETVGNNSAKLTAAIEHAAKERKVPLTITARRSGNAIHLTLAAQGEFKSGTDVYWAIAENQVESHVSAGENGGRMLTHTAVVRSLTGAGKLPQDGKLEADVQADGKWGKSGLRVVAFLANHDSGKIAGAAVTSLQ